MKKDEQLSRKAIFGMIFTFEIFETKFSILIDI